MPYEGLNGVYRQPSKGLKKFFFFTVNRQKCKLLEINHQNVSKYLKSHTISVDLHVISAPGEFLIWKNQFPNVLKKTLFRHYNTLELLYVWKYFKILQVKG